MWLIRWIVITVVILILVGFLGLNQDELVDVDFLFWETPRIALSYALFFAFALGMLVHLFIGIGRQFQLRSQISRQKKEIRKLQDELEKLRNLAIEEDLIQDQHNSLDRSDQPGA